jgi:hypothetical protein
MVPMTLVDDVKEPIGRVSAVGEGTPLSPPLPLSWLRFVRLACVSMACPLTAARRSSRTASSGIRGATSFSSWWQILVTHADVRDGHPLQAFQHERVRALHDVGARVRVQHVAGRHPSRSCAGRSSTSFMNASDATGPSRDRGASQAAAATRSRRLLPFE